MSRNNLRNIDLLGYRHREEEMRLDLKRYVDSDMDKDMILYHDNTHLYLLIEKGSEWADKYIKMKSGNAVMLSEIVYPSEHDIAVSVAIEELLLDTVITVSYDSSFNSIVNNYINNFLRDQDYTDEEPERKSVDYRKNPKKRKTKKGLQNVDYFMAKFYEMANKSWNIILEGLNSGEYHYVALDKYVNFLTDAPIPLIKAYGGKYCFWNTLSDAITGQGYTIISDETLDDIFRQKKSVLLEKYLKKIY